MNVTLEQARAIVAGALNARAELGFKPLAVVVLDSGGHVVCLEREDGASFGRVDIARGKANAVVALGMGSRVLMARAEQQAYFVTAAGAALGGTFVPVPGAVLLRDAQGTLIGAVGISGDVSDNDEAAALAGVEAAGLTGQVD